MFGDQTTNLAFTFLREWLTGGLFPLSAMFALILLVFMAENAAVYGKNWTRRPGVATACILFWLLALHSSRFGFAWLTLKAVNDDGEVPEWLQQMNGAGMVLTAMALGVVMLKGIHHFTPARWGHKYWIISVVFTGLFLLLARNLPNLN